VISILHGSVVIQTMLGGLTVYPAELQISHSVLWRLAVDTFVAIM